MGGRRGFGGRRGGNNEELKKMEGVDGEKNENPAQTTTTHIRRESRSQGGREVFFECSSGTGLGNASGGADSQ